MKCWNTLWFFHLHLIVTKTAFSFSFCLQKTGRTCTCNCDKLNLAAHSLLLNDNKSKELIFDFGTKKAKTHTTVYISGAELEQVNSFMFLGINVTKNLHLNCVLQHLQPGKREDKVVLPKESQEGKIPLPNSCELFSEEQWNAFWNWHQFCIAQDRKALQQVPVYRATLTSVKWDGCAEP